MAITGANSLDFLKGPLVQFDYGAWVTAGAGATFTYGGWIDNDIEIEFIREKAKIEPGNSTYPVDAYFTKSGVIVRGTLMEASLRKLQAVCGGADADVSVSASTAALKLTEYSANNWKQVKLTIIGQSMTPQYTESTALLFVSRTVTLWRCLFGARGGIKLDRTGIWKVPFEIEAFYDTSVTEVTATGVGRIGQIKDLTA